MPDTSQQGSALMAVSNALVRLHKDQFGRGPTNARAHFAGADVLVCVLEDVLLPAEHRLVELGDPSRVREQRLAYQAATAPEFIAVVEQQLRRKVRAFASAIDVSANVTFENYWFETLAVDTDTDTDTDAE